MHRNLAFLSRVQRRWLKRTVRCLYFVLSAAVVAIYIRHWTWTMQISFPKSEVTTLLNATQVHTLASESEHVSPSSMLENSSKHKSTLITRTPCQRNYFLIILVASAPANFEQRRTIRQTWASDSYTMNPRWKTLFMQGQTRNSSHSEMLQREEALFGDLIRGDYYEDYWNQTLKIEMGFEWAARYCNFSFLLKADDDVFINTPAVVKLLNNARTPKEKLYLGFVHTDPKPEKKGKWRVSKQEYSEKFYPNFCAGPGYILSRDVVISFVNVIDTIPKFRIDDVYVGMLAKKAGVIPRHDAGFQTPPKTSMECVLRNDTLVRHGAVGQCLLDLFEMARKSLS